MVNSVQAIFDEVKEAIIICFISVFFIIILGTLATIPGASQETKTIAEQGQQTINWLVIFYLGLPSVGFIALIVWIVKKIKDSAEDKSYYLCA
jgi:cyanate permease